MTRTVIFILLAAILSMLTVPAAAQIKPDLTADVGLFSKYVWRGLVVTDGPVLQPAASVGMNGVTVGAWANADIDDANERSGEVTEVDIWASYGIGIGLVEVEAGVVHYGFPDAEGDTSELYLTGSVSLPFSPTVSLYRDLDAAEGFYASLGISHGLALSPATTIDLAAAIGTGDESHNEFYYAGAGSGAADLSLTASWTWHPAPMLSVTPQAMYTTLLGDVSDAMDAAGADTDALVFGVSAGFSF